MIAIRPSRIRCASKPVRKKPLRALHVPISVLGPDKVCAREPRDPRSPGAGHPPLYAHAGDSRALVESVEIAARR
jgi:hypothetical protein